MQEETSVIILFSDKAGKEFLSRHKDEKHDLGEWTGLIESSPSYKAGDLSYDIQRFGTPRDAAVFAVGVCLAGMGYTENDTQEERYTFRCIHGKMFTSPPEIPSDGATTAIKP